MSETARVLIVEDLASDAELCEREVRKSLGACLFRRVETREDYLAALQELQPTLIVSDFKMPRFDGLTALQLAQERCPDVPFIILTGSMNEDTAVECMRAGAWDYVIKEHVKRLGAAVQGALGRQRDITARRRSQDRDQLSRGLLEVLNHQGTEANQIREILQRIKHSTDIEAVGIRLTVGDEFPYLETNGFPADFVQMERHLCAHDEHGEIVRDEDGRAVLECICGNVLRGRTGSQLPFFTEGGSFWCNCTTELLASTGEQERQTRTRNRCHDAGYESVALIPLRSDGEVIGLLQLNDRRRNRFDVEMIRFFEGVGASIGIALARERAARELQESKGLVDSIVENVPLMIFLKEAEDLRFVVFNRAGEELLGYDRKDLLGKNNLDLFPPEQAAFFMAKDREVLGGGVLVDIPEEPILTAKKGQRLLHTRKLCIKGTDGVTRYLLGISEDITERKRLEIEHEKLERQVRVSQKMDAIGNLAGGVAHDFNNLLSVILSYTGFALDGVPEGDPQRDDLLEVKKAALHAVALTRQLLAFGRKQVLQPVPLSLNQIALGVERMLGRILGEDVELVHVLAPDLGLTLADPGQIEQVLMNLVVNARDAMAQGGMLRTETSNVEVDGELAAHNGAVEPGRYVQLVVTDTGCGMDAQTQARIFEPFFTTKERGKGTGLGLSTVYGIVKQSGGSISVESEPGQGATFKILLPRDLSVRTETSSMPPAVPTRTTGAETILVVEDEEVLRRVARRALEAAGYRVLTASGGDEALELYAQHLGAIGLVLTDVVMPGMSGGVLAERLKSTNPTLKVLYMSGYADEAIVHHGVLDAGTHFLAKPFTGAELTQKVREVLDGGDTIPADRHEAQG